ncbi:MAG: hypothetical protein IJ503_03290 [Akkermansia sp.]|nr:hypothetical protein [Akkermansia sp.]
MIVDVYDLTGALTRTRYEVEDENYHLLERVLISDVLIVPDEQLCRNQRPYLQEREKPILRDFVQEDGSFDYKRAHFVRDFFQDEEKSDIRLEYFFKALHSSTYVDRENPADRNVILIPDNFSAEYQEKILRNCELPRQSTTLLWRSVAACLGNMEFLCENGVEEEMSVYILDEQQAYKDISILKIVAADDGTLVPQRKAYRHSDLYPTHELLKFNPTSKYFPGNEFYRYTFYGDFGNHIVWDKESNEYSVTRFSKRPVIRYTRLPGSCWNADAVLSIGASYNQGRVWEGVYRDDVDGDSLSKGAAIFVARRVAGKPTYFDECTGLYIVVQDIEQENIYAKELIAANERCNGGEVILGTMNEDCFIKAGTDNVFFLLSEEKGDDVRLKELNYQFKGGCVQKKEPLKLYPSIIPGQGIAKVRVEGESQLGAPVELDLLKMAWTEPEKTVNKLRAEIKHSYPLDMPDVVANERLWRKVEADVRAYMRNRLYRNKDLFAKLSPVDSKAEGIERLNRKNVFGYAENHRYPISPAIFKFDALFHYMVDDYLLCKRRGNIKDMYNVLAMISRTYQGDFKAFSVVKRDMLKIINTCADGTVNSISKHVMTACANLLRTCEELTNFFEAYTKVIHRKMMSIDSSEVLKQYWRNKEFVTDKNKESIIDIKGVEEWNRGLYWLLVSNNDMLKYINSHQCEQCMDHLMAMLFSHFFNNKPKLFTAALKTLLFMLTRRKFDKTFLISGPVRRNAEEILNIIIENANRIKEKHAKVQRELYNPQQAALADSLLNFITGSGSLDDLVAIATLDD